MESQCRDFETVFEPDSSAGKSGFVKWLRFLERRFMEEDEEEVYTDYREELVRCWPSETNEGRE